MSHSFSYFIWPKLQQLDLPYMYNNSQIHWNLSV